MPPGVAELPDSARLEWLWSEYEKQMEEVKHYQEEGMDIFPTPGQTDTSRTHQMQTGCEVTATAVTDGLTCSLSPHYSSRSVSQASF